jgi:serine phosphatase RsbU (regulator of sigma subunit)
MPSANSIPSTAPAASRVLVIDDDPQICRIFQKVLASRGYQVANETDGSRGLATAEQDSPDLVLLDLNLPVVGGMEILRQLSQKRPELPVIIVSGSGTMNDAIAALKLGAWDYLIKPLPDMAALIRAVESNLERSRLLRQNQQIRLELELHNQQIQEDEEAGRKIQARLFPPQDWTLEEYQFQYWTIPSLVLSGDLVDYFSLDDEYAAFYCADISGHGVSSALVTVLVKSLITKYREYYADRLDRLVLEPDRLLAQLNKDLLHEKLGKHLTIFFGVINRQSNTLCFASGGQYPPPLLFTPGAVHPLESNGMAVGLFPYAEFESENVDLPAAFRLAVFSDGALDALTLPSPEDRLAFLKTLATRAALQRFIDETGDRKQLPDDLTILSISRGDMP